jgi:hypothetical protein
MPNANVLATVCTSAGKNAPPPVFVNTIVPLLCETNTLIPEAVEILFV